MHILIRVLLHRLHHHVSRNGTVVRKVDLCSCWFFTNGIAGEVHTLIPSLPLRKWVGHRRDFVHILFWSNQRVFLWIPTAELTTVHETRRSSPIRHRCHTWMLKWFDIGSILRRRALQSVLISHHLLSSPLLLPRLRSMRRELRVLLKGWGHLLRRAHDLSKMRLWCEDGWIGISWRSARCPILIWVLALEGRSSRVRRMSVQLSFFSRIL